MRDMRDNMSNYFDVVSKNEKDMMNTTKNMVQRTRLQRQVDYTEDFRKRIMTQEYGNYEKYEKNAVVQEVDRGEDDFGYDKFMINYHDMMKRMQTNEGDDKRKHEFDTLEDVVSNENYEDQTIERRLAQMIEAPANVDAAKEREAAMRLRQ